MKQRDYYVIRWTRHYQQCNLHARTLKSCLQKLRAMPDAQVWAVRNGRINDITAKCRKRMAIGRAKIIYCKHILRIHARARFQRIRQWEIFGGPNSLCNRNARRHKVSQ